jgi:hypothetical protein
LAWFFGGGGGPLGSGKENRRETGKKKTLELGERGNVESCFTELRVSFSETGQSFGTKIKKRN